MHCLKKGGDRCYAVGGLNRYHAILGGGPSFIVHPSNLAPALIALGASIKLVGPGGARSIELEQFFTLPKVDPSRENVLQAGEVITEIVVPAPPVGSRGVYIEAREKQSFDWPLVSVAAVVMIDPDMSSERRANRDGRGGADSVAGAAGRAGARGRDARSGSRGERGRRGAQGRASIAP